MNELIGWLVAFMMSGTAQPSVAETQERYRQIALDVVEVVQEQDPLFTGPDGRIQTAALLTSIMWYESRFEKSVEVGRLRSPNACLMQINVGRRKTLEGWTAQDLRQDRHKCLRAGLRIARSSFSACKNLPRADWLRAYVSGSCGKGAQGSHLRMGRAYAWLRTHPLTFDDKVFNQPIQLSGNFLSTYL